MGRKGAQSRRRDGGSSMLPFFSMKGNEYVEMLRSTEEKESGMETHYVSRLLGLPGERIKIHGGKVYANDRELGEKDGVPPIHYIERAKDVSGAEDEREYQVPEGEYFFLSDNPPNASDSRYWGFVPKRNIVGKVTLIYYPFNRIGRPVYPSK